MVVLGLNTTKDESEVFLGQEITTRSGGHCRQLLEKMGLLLLPEQSTELQICRRSTNRISLECGARNRIKYEMFDA